MPRWRPNRVSASRVGSDTCATMPPMRHDVANERGRLALDRRLVAVLTAGGVEEMLELEDLSPAQLADRGGEEPGDVGAQRRGQRRRAGEEEVAGEDRHDVAPAGVDAGHAAPGLGFVDDVVVVERSQVDQLHRDRAGDRRRRGRGWRRCSRTWRRARAWGGSACPRLRSGARPHRPRRDQRCEPHRGASLPPGTDRRREEPARRSVPGRWLPGRSCNHATQRREHSPTQDC